MINSKHGHWMKRNDSNCIWHHASSADFDVFDVSFCLDPWIHLSKEFDVSYGNIDYTVAVPSGLKIFDAQDEDAVSGMVSEVFPDDLSVADDVLGFDGVYEFRYNYELVDWLKEQDFVGFIADCFDQSEPVLCIFDLSKIRILSKTRHKYSGPL
jgi:hypothetical protein